MLGRLIDTKFAQTKQKNELLSNNRFSRQQINRIKYIELQIDISEDQ